MRNFAKLLAIVCLIFIPSIAQAQLSGMTFENAGTLLGHATIFNAGSGLTCTISGAKVTCTTTGTIGGSVSSPFVPYATSNDTIANTDFGYATTTYESYIADLFSTQNNSAAIFRSIDGGGGAIDLNISGNHVSANDVSGLQVQRHTDGRWVDFDLDASGGGAKRIRLWTNASGQVTTTGAPSEFRFSDDTIGVGVPFIAVSENGMYLMPVAATSGTESSLVVTEPTATGQTASTEIHGVNFNLSATRTWATGAITTQREFLIQAPTYAFATASTITNAATLDITGAPIAGLNATITNAWALRVEAGNTLLSNTKLILAGTTNILDLADSGNTDRIWVDSNLVFNGNNASWAGAMAVRGDATNNRPLVLVPQSNAFAYGFQFDGSNNLNLRYMTGGVNEIALTQSGTPSLPSGLTASGSTAIDLSGSTGAFKTPTGANTFDGSSNTFSTSITLSTNATGLVSSTADGATAVAAIVDTTTAWSNGTAKLTSWRNNGVEKGYFRQDGVFLTVNTIFAPGFQVTGTGGFDRDSANTLFIGSNNATLIDLGPGGGGVTTHSFGNMNVESQAASAGTPLQNSPGFIMTPHYWTGAADQFYNETLTGRLDSTTGPKGHIGFDFGGVGNKFQVNNDGSTTRAGVTFANLDTTWGNGTEQYCSDCTIANPCTSGGTGAIAKRLNGVWVCN